MHKTKEGKVPPSSLALRSCSNLAARCASLLFAAGATLAVGCAAGSGVIEEKLADGSARVTLPERDVKVGDRVTLVKEGCEADKPRRRIPSEERCRDHVRGTGEVTRALGEGRADVKFGPGITFEPGDTVELGHR